MVTKFCDALFMSVQALIMVQRFWVETETFCAKLYTNNRTHVYFIGLVKDCSISIADALEILLSWNQMYDKQGAHTKWPLMPTLYFSIFIAVVGGAFSGVESGLCSSLAIGLKAGIVFMWESFFWRIEETNL